MFSMNLFTISIAIIFVFAQAKDHPTLPTQWTAITIEPGAGEGQESYNFVAEPSTDNPSSMWSRYKGCQRLIHVDNYSGGTRYLLGCESVKCCKEPSPATKLSSRFPMSNTLIPREGRDYVHRKCHYHEFRREDGGRRVGLVCTDTQRLCHWRLQGLYCGL